MKKWIKKYVRGLQMKFKIKIKKGTEHKDIDFKKITDIIYKKISKDFYDKKKGHYVDEIQRDIIIEVKLIKI